MVTQQQLRSGTITRTQMVKSVEQARQTNVAEQVAQQERVKQAEIQRQQQIVAYQNSPEVINAEAENMAIGWVNRKIKGKRIVTSTQDLEGRELKVTELAFQKYKELLSDKATLMAVSAGNEGRIGYTARTATEVAEFNASKPSGQLPTRYETIKDIREGLVEGVSIKGTRIIGADGTPAGVRGGQVFNVRTGEVLNAPRQETGTLTTNIPIGVNKTDNIKYPEINPATGKPYGTLTKSLNFGERMKAGFENVKSEFLKDYSQSADALPKDYRNLALFSANFKAVGNVVGVFTGEVVSAKEKFESYLYKTGNIGGLSFKGEFNPFYGSEQTSTLIKEVPKEVAMTAPFFIPVVSELLVIGGGTETVMRTDTKLWQKSLGVVAVAAGIWGLKTRLSPTPEQIATKVPTKQNINIKIITDTSRTTKNIPKIKIVQDANLKIPKVVKSGVVTETKPINPRAITTITSPSDKTFKILEVSDKYGNVAGVMQKGGGRGIFGQVRDLYKTTYKLNPKTKEVTYNIFKNDKFLKTVTQKGESQFGLTERLLVSSAKVSSTKVVPIKIKLRASTQTKVYEQELVSLKYKKIGISGELSSKETLSRMTTLSPAKQNINYYKSSLGKDIKAVFIKKRLTGKFSKSSPPDIEVIKGKIVRPNEIVIGSTEVKTPRFEDVIVQSFKGEGEFTIVNQNALQRYGSKFLSNKKGQLQLIAPRTMQQEQLVLQANVKVPAFKTSELNTQFKIFVPEIAQVSKSSMNLGLFGFANLKSLEQARALEQIKALSTAKANVFEQARPQIVEQIKTNTFVQDRAIVLAQQQPQPQEQSTQKAQDRLQQKSQFKTNFNEPKRIEEPFKIIPPPALSLGDNLMSYLKSKKKKRRTIYEAFSKRFGKELSLGKFESQSRAENVLGKYLTGTLAASGRIKAEGRTLAFGELTSLKGRGFTPGKRDLFKVVQARGFRLGTGSERREIKQAKRKKLKVW